MTTVIRKYQDADGVTHENAVGSARTKCGRRIHDLRMAEPVDVRVDCIDCIAGGDRGYRPTISPLSMPNLQQVPRKK